MKTVCVCMCLHVCACVCTCVLHGNTISNSSHIQKDKQSQGCHRPVTEFDCACVVLFLDLLQMSFF
jgi:hypothetical protein